MSRFERKLRRRLEGAPAGTTVIGGEVAAEGREALKKMILEPGYLRCVEELRAVMVRWRESHPLAVLVWKAKRGEFLSGSLGSAFVRAQLGGSPDALELLAYADVETGGRYTVLQARLALATLGWCP